MTGCDFAGLGIPDESQYVALYCERTGRKEIPNWEYYLAFNMFRLAAILQGITARALQGNAASTDAVAAGKRARPLADEAWRYAQRLIAGH